MRLKLLQNDTEDPTRFERNISEWKYILHIQHKSSTQKEKTSLLMHLPAHLSFQLGKVLLFQAQNWGVELFDLHGRMSKPPHLMHKPRAGLNEIRKEVLKQVIHILLQFSDSAGRGLK